MEMKKIKLEKVDLDLYSHEYENGFRIFLLNPIKKSFDRSKK
jgi:hypothetical protein